MSHPAKLSSAFAEHLRDFLKRHEVHAWTSFSHRYVTIVYTFDVVLEYIGSVLTSNAISWEFWVVSTKLPLGVADEALFVTAMRRIREGLGISQGEMAARLNEAGWAGFRQATVSRLEKGERTVRLAEAYAIAKTLGIPLQQMTDEAALDENATRARRIGELDGLIHELNEQLALNRQKLDRLERMLVFYQEEKEHLAAAYAGGDRAAGDQVSAAVAQALLLKLNSGDDLVFTGAAEDHDGVDYEKA